MSNHVTSLLRKKRLEIGLTAKAVILLMGDLASDEGEGIWASKATIARELETSDRTIQRTIAALEEAGFVAEVGRKKHRNGFTFEYRICIEKVRACEDCHPTHRHPSPQHVEAQAQDVTPDRVSPPTERHPTPDTLSPQDPTECHPNQSKPSQEPNNISEAQQIRAALEQFAGSEAVASFIAYRRKIRKPLTATAAKRQAEQLGAISASGGDASDALGMAEERGWQAVKADWYFNAKGQGNDQRTRTNYPTPHTDPTADAIAIAARSRRPSGPDRLRG